MKGYCKNDLFGRVRCVKQCAECQEYQTSLDVPNALTSPWVALPGLFIVLAFVFYFGARYANRFVNDEDLTFSVAAMVFIVSYVFISFIIIKRYIQ